MNDFYKRYINRLFKEIEEDVLTYKSPFRQNLSLKVRLIYFYERIQNFVTGLLSNHKLKSVIFYKKNYIKDNLKLLEMTYSSLGDEDSKNKFLEYIVFKTLKSNNHKLNIDLDEVKEKENYISTLKEKKLLKEYTNIGSLSIFDLNAIGFDIRIIYNELGILIDFIFEQYAYKKLVKVYENDVVIDCGGATGDTAIYFASKGAKKVIVYEFIESNIALIYKQIELNPKYNSIIEILDKPVWSDSNIELSYLDKGNASRVDKKGVYPNVVPTLSIDDMVKEKNLERVDFIKMDIEGAEVPALVGAKETIRRYKPKLAICVYHKEDDLVTIPNLIKDLNPNYEFYFDYYTDIGWEAVLYAIDRDSK